MSRNEKTLIKIVTILVFAAMFMLALTTGCSSKTKVERGDLPFYDAYPSMQGSYKPFTIKNIYNFSDAAAIVSFVDGPEYFVKDIYLEPGSGEEAIYLKDGVKPVDSYQLYTVKIIQLLDDHDSGLTVDEVIKIKCKTEDINNNPFHLHIKDNPEQKFVLILYASTYHADEGYYAYSPQMQYYEKDGSVFSATKIGDMDQYSGLSIDQFTKVLKQIERRND
jgi:hypothetical protein